MTKNILSTFDFYELLSDSFDQMMVWSTRIGQEGMFFKKLVNDHKLRSSLDVACGTGFHVIMFRRLGLDAVGVDISPKMIEKAKTNSVACGVTVDFVLGDFNSLSKRFAEGFDVITFMGDTLGHIKDKASLNKVIQCFYNILNPGGILVLQTRNYEWVVKNQIRFMPPILSRNGADETLFTRLLDFNPKSMDYSIVKFHNHENHWNNVILTTAINPTYKDELDGALKSAGFKEVAAYQNFSFDDFDKNSSDLLLVAKKKGMTKAATKKKKQEQKILKPLVKTAASKPQKKETAKKSTPSKKPIKKGRKSKS